MYKIISKVLENRLKLVLQKIVSSSQNAFIRGRQIWTQSWWLMNVWIVGFDLGSWEYNVN